MTIKVLSPTKTEWKALGADHKSRQRPSDLTTWLRLAPNNQIVHHTCPPPLLPEIKVGLCLKISNRGESMRKPISYLSIAITLVTLAFLIAATVALVRQINHNPKETIVIPDSNNVQTITTPEQPAVSTVPDPATITPDTTPAPTVDPPATETPETAPQPTAPVLPGIKRPVVTSAPSTVDFQGQPTDSTQ